MTLKEKNPTWHQNLKESFLEKISKTKLLGLSGKEEDVKKYADKPAKRSNINNHDFDLFVKFRKREISKEEFNNKIQNKDHFR
jgi:hypothetical protein